MNRFRMCPGSCEHFASCFPFTDIQTCRNRCRYGDKVFVNQACRYEKLVVVVFDHCRRITPDDVSFKMMRQYDKSVPLTRHDAVFPCFLIGDDVGNADCRRRIDHPCKVP